MEHHDALYIDLSQAAARTGFGRTAIKTWATAAVWCGDDACTAALALLPWLVDDKTELHLSFFSRSLCLQSSPECVHGKAYLPP